MVKTVATVPVSCKVHRNTGNAPGRQLLCHCSKVTVPGAIAGKAVAQQYQRRMRHILGPHHRGGYLYRHPIVFCGDHDGFLRHRMIGAIYRARCGRFGAALQFPAKDHHQSQQNDIGQDHRHPVEPGCGTAFLCFCHGHHRRSA